MTASDFRVTLLGTGTPVPSPDRFGPCTLVEAGDQKVLIGTGLLVLALSAIFGLQPDWPTKRRS